MTDIENLKRRSNLLEFYESAKFKEAERARIEASKPTTHEYTDATKAWVYCPIEDQRRPVWMCEYEHGDRSAADYQGYDEEIEYE